MSLPEAKSNYGFSGLIKKVTFNHRGYVTAVAGDIFNDTPALAQADVGIQVGTGIELDESMRQVAMLRSSPVQIAEFMRLTKIA